MCFVYYKKSIELNRGYLEEIESVIEEKMKSYKSK